MNKHQTQNIPWLSIIAISGICFFARDLLKVLASPRQTTIEEVASAIADNFTKNMPNDIIREKVRVLDSMSYDGFFELYDNTTDSGDMYTLLWDNVPYFTQNHCYNKLAEPSLLPIQDFMKANKIESVADIIQFSNNITYETAEAKDQKYGGSNPMENIFALMPKPPIQTLIELSGDCDDMSILYYSMLTILNKPAMLCKSQGHMTLFIPHVCVNEVGLEEVDGNTAPSDLRDNTASEEGEIHIEKTYNGSVLSQSVYVTIDGTTYSPFEATNGSQGLFKLAQADIKALFSNKHLLQKK